MAKTKNSNPGSGRPINKNNNGTGSGNAMSSIDPNERKVSAYIPPASAYKSNGGGSGSGGNISAIADIYAQLAAQQQADAQNLYQQQRAAAEFAAKLREEARLSGYSAVTGARQQNYDSGVSSLNLNVDDALQEAYILKKMQERNFAQQLSALGYSGGASESSMLSLASNYGTNRAGLEKTRAQELSQLSLALQQGLATDKRSYENSRIQDSIAQFETTASLENGYSKQLSSARQKLAEQQAALLLKQFK